MARALRTEYSEALQHVMSRGNGCGEEYEQRDESDPAYGFSSGDSV